MVVHLSFIALALTFGGMVSWGNTGGRWMVDLDDLGDLFQPW